MKALATSLCLSLLLSACGSDTNEKPYNIELTLADVNAGVADINITVSSTDGHELPDGNIQVSPLMNMVSGMQHGTPLENAVGPLSADGTFTSTAYFLMPSNMPSGMAMGDWSITVSFDGYSETFPITVDMMGSDVKQLKGGDDDQIMGMSDGMSTDRSYYIFNRGRHINSEMNTNLFEVYVAARETMMDYQAISEGNILNPDTPYELEIQSVVVDMCIADCSSENNWTTAIELADFPGIYQGQNLGLQGNSNDTVEVRLTVNNALKDNGAVTDPSTNVTFSFADAAMGEM